MLAWGHTVSAQATRPTTTAPAVTTRTSDGGPDYPKPIRVPIELLNPPKPQAIILPSDPSESTTQPADKETGVVADVTPTKRLLPDGYAIANRLATFKAGAPWTSFELDELEGLPTSPDLRVLPNRQLMMVERVMAEDATNNRFRITGRITEFLGHNYILLEQVTAPPANTPATPKTTKQPEQGESAAQTPPDRVPTAEEIINQLMKNAPSNMLRSQNPPASRPALTNKGDMIRPVQPEGTLVPEIPGRLVRGGDSWTFIRESKGDKAGSESYSLMPNRLLEVMVSASQGGNQSVVFLVSGELTEYRGQNYMLVRKVLIRRDMGNLQ